MYQLIMIIHILTAICLIALVLVQQGKGASMGAAFGSGASQTLFGSRGSGSFLLKVTIGFIVLFFITSLCLNRMVTTSLKRENQIPLPTAVQPHETESKISPNSVPMPVKK